MRWMIATVVTLALVSGACGSGNSTSDQAKLIEDFIVSAAEGDYAHARDLITAEADVDYWLDCVTDQGIVTQVSFEETSTVQDGDRWLVSGIVTFDVDGDDVTLPLDDAIVISEGGELRVGITEDDPEACIRG